jgi:hypothetical protein
LEFWLSLQEHENGGVISLMFVILRWHWDGSRRWSCC